MRQRTRKKNRHYKLTNIQIRHLLKDFNEAVVKRDVDKIMSFYSPNIVAYDIVPPLQFVGKKAYQKSWEEAFISKSEGNILYDAKDWSVNGSYAYN